MKVFYSESFRGDFQNLPNDIKKIAEKKLKLFIDNFRYPSLRIKKIKGLKNIWEGSISKGYRFTFNKESNFYILRRIGTHDILKKEKR